MILEVWLCAGFVVWCFVCSVALSGSGLKGVMFIFCEVVYMALMDEHGSYLTADEKFVCQIMETGLFDVWPFVGFSSSDRVIVEISFRCPRTLRRSVKNRRRLSR